MALLCGVVIIKAGSSTIDAQRSDCRRHRYGAAPVPIRAHGVGKPAHDARIEHGHHRQVQGREHRSRLTLFRLRSSPDAYSENHESRDRASLKSASHKR
jgi:hypothetical protein